MAVPGDEHRPTSSKVHILNYWFPRVVPHWVSQKALFSGHSGRKGAQQNIQGASSQLTPAWATEESVPTPWDMTGYHVGTMWGIKISFQASSANNVVLLPNDLLPSFWLSRSFLQTPLLPLTGAIPTLSRLNFRWRGSQTVLWRSRRDLVPEAFL